MPVPEMLAVYEEVIVTVGDWVTKPVRVVVRLGLVVLDCVTVTVGLAVTEAVTVAEAVTDGEAVTEEEAVLEAVTVGEGVQEAVCVRVQVPEWLAV